MIPELKSINRDEFFVSLIILMFAFLILAYIATVWLIIYSLGIFLVISDPSLFDSLRWDSLEIPFLMIPPLSFAIMLFIQIQEFNLAIKHEKFDRIIPLAILAAAILNAIWSNIF